jgi:hypothetical protein
MINKQLSKKNTFDPCYLEVDRILTATELFPIIHQKKVESKYNIGKLNKGKME